MPKYEKSEFNYNDLLAGGDFTVLEIATIDETVSVKRGTVLGRVSAQSTFKICKKGASDGSEIPCAILADDLEAGASNKDKYVYLSGKFNKDAIIYDSSIDNKNKSKIELHKNSIFLI